MAERPLKIVQILPALAGGGVERGTVEVATALVAAGHEAYVISAGGRMVNELDRIGARHIRWDLGKKSLLTLRHVLPLRRWLREQAIDIVHARSRLPAWIAWLAWRGMAARARPHFVTTVHGLYTVNAYSAIMTKGERVIAVSESVKSYIQRNYRQTDAACIHVIHHGVDPAVYAYGWRPSAAWFEAWLAQFPQLAGRLVITLPARLTRWKGQEHFIRIIAGLKRRGLSVHGLLVGDAHPGKHRYMERLRAQIDAQGMADDISFAGHRFDLREIMAVSHAVVSLSLDPEAFGRVTLEALALGVPVAAYDHGGVGEQLAAVFPAGRVPVGDECAMEALLADWCVRRPSVPPGQPFTLDKTMMATLGVYDKLTGVRNA